MRRFSQTLQSLFRIDWRHWKSQCHSYKDPFDLLTQMESSIVAQRKKSKGVGEETVDLGLEKKFLKVNLKHRWLLDPKALKRNGNLIEDTWIFIQPRRRAFICPHSPMKILQWNCRGMSHPDSIRYLKGMVNEVNPDVVFLIETKANRNRIESVCRSL